MRGPGEPPHPLDWSMDSRLVVGFRHKGWQSEEDRYADREQWFRGDEVMFGDEGRDVALGLQEKWLFPLDVGTKEQLEDDRDVSMDGEDITQEDEDDEPLK